MAPTPPSLRAPRRSRDARRNPTAQEAIVSITNRRQFLRAGALGIAGALVVRRTAAQAPTSAGPVDPKLIDDLVAANRILADQGVVDGYGHVSVRHPADAQRYLMSRSIAPE